LSCLETRTKVGIDVLESQAGYITLPEFKPGNSYMPFSSQLDFMGNPIPYWHYVSGNNIQEEQVPTKADMQNQLSKFIEDNAKKCDFETYYENGFEVIQGEPKATVTIANDNVNVKLNMNMEISKANDTVLIKNHDISVQSKLGILYNSARKVYDKEQKELFLENYAVDDLRLYAPVDGVEISCSPKTWDADKIFSDLQDAIETNTLALTTETHSSKEGKYFVVNGIGENARFINSKTWASSFEVSPSEENILIANPVGNQPGLGVLGFCYIPYHFVYNVKYPVLVQVSSGEETFQFPIAVVVQGNKPRQALNSTANEIVSELCQYKNTKVSVKTYDTNLNPVPAYISYECFGEKCNIGNSSGVLTANFPQCANGYVIARADGFEDARELYSTTSEGESIIIMNKLYNLNVKLKVDGADYNNPAVIYFSSEDGSKTVSYPEQNKVKLKEGKYEIQVYVYQSSSIQFQETTGQQCIEIPGTGISGLLGIKEKKCYDIKIPSQLITNVPAGGGKQEYSVSESALKSSNTIEINAKSITAPKTIQEVQNAYQIFETNSLEINLK